MLRLMAWIALALLCLVPIPAYAALSAITLTDVTDQSVWQKDAGVSTGSITVSGTCTGSGTVEYRLVQDGTSTPLTGHDWTTLDTTDCSGGFSGTVTGIPGGTWYNVQVRDSTLTVEDDGANQQCVGRLIAFIGQSQLLDFFTEGTAVTAANDKCRKYADVGGWQVLGNVNGVPAICNEILEDVTDACLGFLQYPVDGAGCSSEDTDPSGNWTDATAGYPYPVFTAGVNTATGGNNALDAFFYCGGGGDADAATEVTYGELHTCLGNLITKARGDFTNGSDEASIPWVQCVSARNENKTGEFVQRWANMQWATYDYVLDVGTNTHLGPILIQFNLRDGSHMSVTAYSVAGARYAQAYLTMLGTRSYARGPKLVNCARGFTSATCDLSYPSGSNYTPNTNPGSGAFRFDVAGVTLMDNSTEKVDTNTIKINFDFIPSDQTVFISYLNDADPAINNIMVGNDSDLANPFPVEPIWNSTLSFTGAVQNTTGASGTLMAECGNDTRIRKSFPTTNYGTDINITLQDLSTAIQRIIMTCDLTSIPTTHTITSANLVMNYYSFAQDNPVGRQVDCFVLDQAFFSNLATYNTYDGSTAWPGGVGAFGDVDMSLSTNANMPASFGDVTFSSMEDMVDDAIQNNSGILHLLCKLNDETKTTANDTAFSFYSEDNGSNVPMLTVAHTAPATASTSVCSSQTGTPLACVNAGTPLSQGIPNSDPGTPCYSGIGDGTCYR